MFPRALLGCVVAISQLFFTCVATAADVQVVKDIAYKSGDQLSSYESERCKLDLYLPSEKPSDDALHATLVWFHGGGLTSGAKDDEFTTKIVQSFAESGIVVVAVNYRLSPKATYPAYVEDAAAAIAWTLNNIANHGGDAKRVYVGGHSAGGYLAAIVGLHDDFLKAAGVENESIAGLIPVSGQMMTHYQIRIERGLKKFDVIADSAAPIYYAGRPSPPILVIYGDRDLPSRAEENAFFVSTFKAAGGQQVEGLVVKDRDHGSVASKLAEADDTGRKTMLKFMSLRPGQRAAK